MIIDAVSVTDPVENQSVTERAVVAFLSFIERRLNVSVVRNIRNAPSSPRLGEPLRLARTLLSNGVIKDFGRTAQLPDEPRTRSWFAICNDPTSHQTGGTSWEGDEPALYATLAESLERYVWYTQTDYFNKPTRGTVAAIAAHGDFVAPETFAGFSSEQRAGRVERLLQSDSIYTWIRGVSLVNGRNTYMPAHTVSGVRHGRTTGEPMIRRPTTNGLATWSTRSGARLRGALELIERDAYMITWLNQLTLPRIALSYLRAQDPTLARIIAECDRYRIKVHVVQLLTDAPTWAVAVILEDMSGHAPRFAFGLKAHFSLAEAVKKAMTEAMRARRGHRLWEKSGNTWDTSTPVERVGHRERVYYWGVPEHAKQLEFLIAGEEIEPVEKSWEKDTEEEHLSRIVSWCAEKRYDCVSVSLGTSAKNPTPLHIEMVIIPQLQPAYLSEETRAFGGKRLKEIPASLGYTAREEPFADAPHPFS